MKLTLQECIKNKIIKKDNSDLIDKSILNYTKNEAENHILLEELEKKALFKKYIWLIVYSIGSLIVLFFIYKYKEGDETLETMFIVNIVLSILVFITMTVTNYKNNLLKSKDYFEFKKKIKKEIIDDNFSEYLKMANGNYDLFEKAYKNIYIKEIKEDYIEDYIVDYILRHKT